jgi:hypothetical protein
MEETGFKIDENIVSFLHTYHVVTDFVLTLNFYFTIAGNNFQITEITSKKIRQKEITSLSLFPTFLPCYLKTSYF